MDCTGLESHPAHVGFPRRWLRIQRARDTNKRFSCMIGDTSHQQRAGRAMSMLCASSNNKLVDRGFPEALVHILHPARSHRQLAQRRWPTFLLADLTSARTVRSRSKAPAFPRNCTRSTSGLRRHDRLVTLFWQPKYRFGSP